MYTCVRTHAYTSILYMNTRGFTNDTTCIPLEYTCKIRACIHVYGTRLYMRMKCVYPHVSLHDLTWDTREYTYKI